MVLLCGIYSLPEKMTLFFSILKGAAADMRYFARSKFFRS